MSWGTVERVGGELEVGVGRVGGELEGVVGRVGRDVAVRVATD